MKLSLVLAFAIILGVAFATPSVAFAKDGKVTCDADFSSSSNGEFELSNCQLSDENEWMPIVVIFGFLVFFLIAFNGFINIGTNSRSSGVVSAKSSLMGRLELLKTVLFIAILFLACIFLLTKIF